MDIATTTRSLTFARWRFEVLDNAIRLAPWVTLPLGAFVVYWLTLAPTVYGLDSAEFSVASYKLGVPHATGYPLYVMLGKLFTYLPFGDVAYRVNLMSAVFAASTVAVVHRIIFTIIGRQLIAFVSTAALAFSFYFWSSSVVAEVYSLHTLLTAIVLYSLIVWLRGGGIGWLYWASFAWGLSFGDHMSTVLTAPAFAYVVFHGLFTRRIRVKQFIIAALLGLPGLATYAYVPLRFLAEAQPYSLGTYGADGSFTSVDTTTLSGLWWLVTGKQFESFMFAHTGLDLLAEIGRIVGWLTANFFGIGLVAGLVGIARNWTADRNRFVVVMLLFVANVLFFASYGASDKYTMLLPVYMVWTIWIAEGTWYLVRTIQASIGRSQWLRNWPRLYEVAVAGRWQVALFALPVIAFSINYSYADVSSYTWVHDRYTGIIEEFDENALVLAWWPDSAPMYYLQQVEEQRQDVQIVDRYLIEPADEKTLIESALGNRPVYVFGHIPNLDVAFDVEEFMETDVLASKLTLSGRANPRPPIRIPAPRAVPK